MRKSKKIAACLLVASVVLSTLSGNIVLSASDVSISGVLRPGYTVTGNYTGSNVQLAWYRCEDKEDAGVLIPGATSSNYTLVNADGGKFIKFAVTEEGSTQTDVKAVASPLAKISVGSVPAIDEAGDPKYRFALTGDTKTYILLDDNAEDSNSRYFVVAYDSHGSHKFHNNNTLGERQKFNPNNANNIGYWLNNDFKTAGTVAADLRNHIDNNHIWLTAGGGTGGACPNDFTVKCGIAIMSAHEIETYKSRMGWKDGSGAYIWTRTPNRDSDVHILGFKTVKDWAMTGTDDSWSVRPCFWLDESFFTQVHLDVNKMGSTIKQTIRNNYEKSELQGLYTENELVAMGFDPTIDESIKIKNVMAVGNPKPAYTLTGSFVWDCDAIQGESVYRWFWSDSIGGTATEIVSNQSMTITNSLAGKYVWLQVVPRTADGGFGVAVNSEPILIGAALTKPTNDTPSGLQATAPAVNRFKLNDGTNKEYILLDTTSDGRFLVITYDSYGGHIFDTQEVNKFDVNSSTNIGYWLNNEFINSGNVIVNKDTGVTTTYVMSADILNYVDYNAEWLTEAATANGSDFLNKAPLALISTTEAIRYKDKIGYSDAGLKYTWTRTPLDNVHVFRFIYDGRFKTTGRDDAGDVRPIFYLTSDFFKNIKIDVESMGENVAKAIKNMYPQSVLEGLYNQAELAKFGYGKNAVYNVKYTDQNGKALTSLLTAKEISVTTDFVSYSENTQVVMITAIYDKNGNIVALDMAKGNATKNTPLPLKVKIDLSDVPLTAGCTLHTFFWKDMINLKPLCKSLSF